MLNTITVSATEARNDFNEYLNLAAYGGQKVVVERMGKPMVVISAYNQALPIKKVNLASQLKKITGRLGPLPKGMNLENIFVQMKENYRD
ncbi:MAG: type II toxin-antitoxin system Phd/YefM family antitoxin [Candidatus Shapirobacteria bacterium]